MIEFYADSYLLCLWIRPYWFVQLLTQTMTLTMMRRLNLTLLNQKWCQKCILWPSLGNNIVYEVGDSDLSNSRHRGFVFRILCILSLHHCSAVTFSSSFPHAHIIHGDDEDRNDEADSIEEATHGGNWGWLKRSGPSEFYVWGCQPL